MIDEVKRNKDWKIATVVSTLIIVVVAVYMLMKMFTGNPIEGSWAEEDGGMHLEFLSSGELLVTLPELGEAKDVEVSMDYDIDREDKVVTVRAKDTLLQKLADDSDGKFTKEMLDASVDQVETSFGYDMDGSQLTLTEREYGDQMILIRK